MNPLEIVRSPAFQQALVLAAALCGGLWLMTVAARVGIAVVLGAAGGYSPGVDVVIEGAGPVIGT